MTYSLSPEIEHLGDVRFICENPELLVGRLSISTIVSCDELRERAPDLCIDYQEGAIVPDPDTFRPCTDNEVDYYTRLPAGVGLDDPSVIVYFPASDQRFDPYREHPELSFGRTECGSNMLTTTPVTPGLPTRVGMHLDDEEEVPMLGVNYGEGARRFLAATHSSRLLFGDRIVRPNTGDARRRILGDSAIRCLHLELDLFDVYRGYTHPRGVVHCGSRYNLSGVSTVGFYKGRANK